MVRAAKSRSGPQAEKQSNAAPRGHVSATSRGAQARVIRIIGGSMRGRRIRFPDVAEVRPTPDRVRETLFNWLGPRVNGSRCLDLFAGSGALGLEALSRGAASVVFVEQNAAVARALSALVTEWKVQGARVEHLDALRFLAGPVDLAHPAEPFDFVFLDPPFASGVLSRSATLLERHGWLASEALIYVECPAHDALPALPPGWRSLKTKRAGEVGYHLFAKAASGAEPE